MAFVASLHTFCFADEKLKMRVLGSYPTTEEAHRVSLMTEARENFDLNILRKKYEYFEIYKKLRDMKVPHVGMFTREYLSRWKKSREEYFSACFPPSSSKDCSSCFTEQHHYCVEEKDGRIPVVDALDVFVDNPTYSKAQILWGYHRTRCPVLKEEHMKWLSENNDGAITIVGKESWQEPDATVHLTNSKEANELAGSLDPTTDNDNYRQFYHDWFF